jgi:hypothetical protein
LLHLTEVLVSAALITGYQQRGSPVAQRIRFHAREFVQKLQKHNGTAKVSLDCGESTPAKEGHIPLIAKEPFMMPANATVGAVVSIANEAYESVNSTLPGGASMSPTASGYLGKQPEQRMTQGGVSGRPRTPPSNSSTSFSTTTSTSTSSSSATTYKGSTSCSCTVGGTPTRSTSPAGTT